MSRVSGLELATTIVRNDLSTIENTNYFCRFLLKMRREGGRKDHSRLEFHARTLADLRSATILRLEKIPSNTAPDRRTFGWDLFVWLGELRFGYFDKNPAT